MLLYVFGILGIYSKTIRMERQRTYLEPTQIQHTSCEASIQADVKIHEPLASGSIVETVIPLYTTLVLLKDHP